MTMFASKKKERAGLERLSAVLQAKPLPQLSPLALRTLGNQHTPELDYVPANRSATGRREWRAVCQCGYRPTEPARGVDLALDAHELHLSAVITWARRQLAKADEARP